MIQISNPLKIAQQQSLQAIDTVILANTPAPFANRHPAPAKRKTGNAELLTAPVASPLVPRKGAADYLGLAPQTLAQWAVSRRYNLPFIKIGKKAMYRLTDLEAFISENSHGVIGQVEGSMA